MKTRYFPALYLLIALSFQSCKKDKEITYGDAPEIAFVSISPQSVMELQDSITIVISYVDGDGDLGENNANINNLFVTDTRINITYPFRVQQLGPDNPDITIKGKINIVLKNTGITDGSAQQSVTYALFIKDRAGHQSNTITTGAIMVHK